MSKSSLPAHQRDEQGPIRPEDTEVSWLREIIRQIRLAWRLFWDPRVSWALKLIPPATLVYLISPLDILPDVTLGLGQLDDIAVILLGVKLFVELAPAEVVREHLRALGERVTGSQETEESIVIEGEMVEQED